MRNDSKNRLFLVLILLSLFPLSACGGSERNAPSSIAVLADSSLENPFTKLGQEFESENPGTTVTFTFGESDALAQQAVSGGPGDLLTTTDVQTMDSAQEVQLDDPETFATKGSATYQIVSLTQSKNTSLSQEFINLVTGPTGQKVLSAAGFAAP
jgi:ABC-type molybdate transport system substrate-binding protein